MLLRSTETEYTSSDDGEYTLYYFDPPVPNKKLSDIFWIANSAQLKVIAEEVLLWDGDKERKVYRTTIKEDADFVQFAFMATYGTNASLIVSDRRGEVYMEKYRRKSVQYSVFQKMNRGTEFRHSKRDASIPKLACEPFASADPYMYCFCVDSGMLVLRRNNHVFVTGNSGKDPTKVDRTGAYAARWVAKNIVAAGLASRCEVQIAYAIGMTDPISVSVETFGTGKVPADVLASAVQRVFDLRPGALIETLHLRDTRYAPLAVYGHFGRGEMLYAWERVDRVEELLEAVKET